MPIMPRWIQPDPVRMSTGQTDGSQKTPAGAPATGPRNVQPSSQPGNIMGRQMPTPQPEVATGASPTQLATPLMQAANSPASPAPAASAPAVPTGPSTSERAAEIARSGSPLMRQAATQGRQYAQSRGLLNSSIAAQASQGAVLERSADLARSDVQDELKRFYAGLDKAQFESNAAYREKALAQERELTGRTQSLNEELGRGSLALDRERFKNDTDYRDRVLAQENSLAERRLDFDRERFRDDAEYRRDVLEQEGEFETRRLDITETENTFRREFDQERFESDESYRRDTLALETTISQQRADIELQRLGLQRAQFKQNTWNSLRAKRVESLAWLPERDCLDHGESRLERRAASASAR